MSFGGSVAAMIKSLKMNRSQMKGSLIKKDDLIKTVESSKNKEPIRFKNSMSAGEFEKFSYQLQQKRKKRIIWQGIFYGMVTIITATIIHQMLH